jgi:hypothetical protein
MLCNKIFLKVPATAIFFVAIILSTLTFTASTFEQSEGMNYTIENIEKLRNQTIQNNNQSANDTGINQSANDTGINQSANDTGINQSANDTGETILLQKNVTDLGSNLTEVAKKLAKSIDEGMKNLHNKSTPVKS